ncbi:MAG: M3 family metallopeptidase [Cloacibacterium normanense]
MKREVLEVGSQKSEDGSFKALLYADYHPRKGKRAGAWMTSFKKSIHQKWQNRDRIFLLFAISTKPTAETPSLLTFNEVTTLFHEFKMLYMVFWQTLSILIFLEHL